MSDWARLFAWRNDPETCAQFLSGSVTLPRHIDWAGASTMTDRKRDPLPEGYQFGDARERPRLAVRFLQRFDIVPDQKPRRDDWYAVKDDDFEGVPI